jgi:hypothetical protein
VSWSKVGLSYTGGWSSPIGIKIKTYSFWPWIPIMDDHKYTMVWPWHGCLFYLFEHELLRFSQVYSIDRERMGARASCRGFFKSISKWSGRIPFPVRFRVDALLGSWEKDGWWFQLDNPGWSSWKQYRCWNIQLVFQYPIGSMYAT